MSFDSIHNEYLLHNLKRIEMCAAVVEDLNDDIIDPIDSNGRADLLLATEDLIIEVNQLYKKVYKMVWNAPFNEDIPEET